MKQVTIKNYKQGLCSFLDSKDIKWSSPTGNDIIVIFYDSEEQLFEIAFEFGCFYSTENNY